MSTGAFIVARLSSSRLPRKALMDVAGKPMLERMVERVRRAKSIDKVVIATSDEPSDDDLEAFAKDVGVGCHRGSLPDIMERVAGAAQAFECDTVVEILGDNPLVHSDLIDDVVDLYKQGDCDYTASVTKEFPVSAEKMQLFALGIRVQAYSLAAALAHKDYPGYLEADDKGSTAYIFEHPDRFRLRYLEASGKWAAANKPDINFAVNYEKNLEMIRMIFEGLLPIDQDFSLDRVMELYDSEPAIQERMGA